METYNIVYKTTNLINNKWYIGVHHTNNLDDGYIGSGLGLKEAIKKYGKHSFKREILYTFNTLDEAYEMEAKLITFDIIESRDNYNLAVGGKVGALNTYSPTKDSIFTTNGWILKTEFDPNIHKGMANNTVVVRDSNGNKTRISKDDPRYLSGELIAWNKGIAQNTSTNEKRSQAALGIPKKRYTCPNCGKSVALQSKKRHDNGVEACKKK